MFTQNIDFKVTCLNLSLPRQNIRQVKRSPAVKIRGVLSLLHSRRVSHFISVVFIVLFFCILDDILTRPSLPASSFASPPSGPSFGALANQSAPSFGGLAQQGAGFGSQPSSFSSFGQPQQQSAGESARCKLLPGSQ